MNMAFSFSFMIVPSCLALPDALLYDKYIETAASDIFSELASFQQQCRRRRAAAFYFRSLCARRFLSTALCPHRYYHAN